MTTSSLGGDSLLAAQVRARLGRQLPLRLVFARPVLADLASAIGRPEQPSAGIASLLPLKPSGSKVPLFCVHPAAGLCWPFGGLVRHLGPDRPLYGLQARGLDHAAPLPESIAEAGELHDVADMYLRAGERAAVARLPAPAGAAELLRQWMRKEACAKALGLGLHLDLRSLHRRPGGYADDGHDSLAVCSLEPAPRFRCCRRCSLLRARVRSVQAGPNDARPQPAA